MRGRLLLPPGQTDTGAPMHLINILPTVLMQMEQAADEQETDITQTHRKTPDAAMRQYELNDTNRRIRNVLSSYPQAEWTQDEAQAVLATLSGIVRASQGDGAVRVAVTITHPNLGNRTAVWDVVPRADAQ